MLQGKMNSTIRYLLDNHEPKVASLEPEERRIYHFGLGLIGLLFREDFLDLPKLPENRFSQDGLFYTLEYFDSEQLWSYGNTRMLLVVWEVKDQSSTCPLNIEVSIENEKNFKLILNDNIGMDQRTMKWVIFSCEDGKYFTEISNYSELKLSDLVKYTQKQNNKNKY